MTALPMYKTPLHRQALAEIVDGMHWRVYLDQGLIIVYLRNAHDCATILPCVLAEHGVVSVCQSSHLLPAVDLGRARTNQASAVSFLCDLGITVR